MLEEREWAFHRLLWLRARDIRLWAVAEAENRRGLFGSAVPAWLVEEEEAAARESALAMSIRVIAAMARYPEVVHERDVRTACMTISEWADNNHLPNTALQYAEAAALVDRLSAHAAAHAGQVCAQNGLDHRAEVWYERGIKIGRRTEDWEWYVRSNIRMGILRYEQGDFRAAIRCYQRARTQAIWAGLPAFAGKAHHDMLLIAIAVRSFSRGDRHARSALEFYPVHYERLPQLAHDYAVLLTTFGCDAEALRLLDLCLPHIERPCERIAVLGTIAKAAAGVGDIDQHLAAIQDVQLLAAMSDLNAAGAFALAAEGAAALDAFDRALRLASRGMEIATRRREREPQRRAAVVLRSIARRRGLPTPPRPDPARVAETVAMFVGRLADLGAQTTDAGAHSRGRGELTKFTIAGR